MTYNVFGGTLSLTQSINQSVMLIVLSVIAIVLCIMYRYRWAFVGDPGSVSIDSDKRRQLRDLAPTFIPHVLRIARRLSARVCFTFNWWKNLAFLIFLIFFVPSICILLCNLFVQ